MHQFRLFRRLLAGLAFFIASANAFASTYTVSIDTSALFGESGQLVFDFIDGGPAANVITLSDFATDGSLGSSNNIGGSSGSLGAAVNLADTDPLLNEHVVAITLGNYLYFKLEATDNAPILPNSSPDGFSFYLLDTLGNSLTNSEDPYGFNALLSLDIDGAGATPIAFIGSSPAVLVTVAEVPIPASALLFASGLLGIARRRSDSLAV